MKGKDKVRDWGRTQIRAPYERVFSKTNKRVCYKGIAKNKFYVFYRLSAKISSGWLY